MKNLWASRNFIHSAVRNEFAIRFSRSKIGAFWMVIYPLAQVLVFALVLSKVIGAKMPEMPNPYAYAIYLMAGQLAWTGFSETIARCTNTFISNANLLKKSVVPLSSFPAVDFIVGAINSLIFFVVIVGIFAVLDHLPGANVVWVIPLIFLNLLFAVGLGFVLGILNVFIRDIGQVIPIILSFGFWLTPIVYVPSVLPDTIRSLIEWNPMYYIVQGFQNALLFDRQPDVVALLWVAFFAISLIVTAVLMLRRAGPEMADVL